jgi:BlaI family penicillinase repressor
MKKRPEKLQGLSMAEWAVMKVLWEGGPMATGEIHQRLAGQRQWAYSTVRTLVGRLVAKGWLRNRRVGNSFLYRAAVPRSRAVRSAIREFTGRVLDGVLSPFVAYYAEERGLTSEEVAQLEEIIKQHRSKSGEE